MQHVKGVIVPHFVDKMVFVALVIHLWMGIVRNLPMNPFVYLLRTRLDATCAYHLVCFLVKMVGFFKFNGLIQENPIKVPDWDENKEKNCLLDCNGNQGNRKWFKMVGFHINFNTIWENFGITHLRPMSWILWWIVIAYQFLLLQRSVRIITLSKKCNSWCYSRNELLCHTERFTGWFGAESWELRWR